MPSLTPVGIPTTMIFHEKLGHKEHRSLFEAIVHFFADKFGRNPKSLGSEKDQMLIAKAAVELYSELSRTRPEMKLQGFEKELSKALVTCPSIKDKTPENLNETINTAMKYLKAMVPLSQELGISSRNGTSHLTQEDIQTLKDQYSAEMREYEKQVEDMIALSLRNNGLLD